VTLLETYSHIGFTSVPTRLEHVVRTVRDVLSSPPAMHVNETEAPLSLPEIYSDRPLPGGRHPSKVMLFAPRVAPESTVVFANGEDGWQTLSVCLSKALPITRVYRFAMSTDKDEWPLFRFEVWQAGVQKRHVSVIKDVDRWKFWQTGEPLREEDVAAYRTRRVRDRLTREYLVLLAERLGFPVGDDRFWQSDSKAVYFEEQRVEQREGSRTPQ